MPPNTPNDVGFDNHFDILVPGGTHYGTTNFKVDGTVWGMYYASVSCLPESLMSLQSRLTDVQITPWLSIRAFLVRGL